MRAALRASVAVVLVCAPVASFVGGMVAFCKFVL